MTLLHKHHKLTAIITASLLLVLAGANTATAQAEKKDAPAKNPVRVLLVTGGHGFDEEKFHAMLDAMPGITHTEAKHPDALAKFRPENRASFDVVLFYDMPKTITAQEKRDFIGTLKAGKGIVVLHHAYCSYQDWPEYQKIIGGRYHQKPWTDAAGTARPASTYKYNVPLRVKVADKTHPVTRGIEDFDIVDEAYCGGSVNPGAQVLLTTDNPLSTPSVAWAGRYEKSRTVTIILGHDKKAWTNPAFAKLLSQAIEWVR